MNLPPCLPTPLFLTMSPWNQKSEREEASSSSWLNGCFYHEWIQFYRDPELREEPRQTASLKSARVRLPLGQRFGGPIKLFSASTRVRQVIDCIWTTPCRVLTVWSWSSQALLALGAYLLSVKMWSARVPPYSRVTLTTQHAWLSPCTKIPKFLPLPYCKFTWFGCAVWDEDLDNTGAVLPAPWKYDLVRVNEMGWDLGPGSWAIHCWEWSRHRGSQSQAVEKKYHLNLESGCTWSQTYQWSFQLNDLVATYLLHNNGNVIWWGSMRWDEIYAQALGPFIAESTWYFVLTILSTCCKDKRYSNVNN